MIFPRVKRSEHSPPWWESGSKSKSSRVTIVLVALLASSIGGLLGTTATGGALFQGTNLVSSSSVIERAPDSVAGIAARVLPSVVSIATRGSGGSGTGSGFIIDSRGLILTNNHVIASVANSGGTLRVRLNNGDVYNAKIIGRDSSYDLAVIKIVATNLPALQFGDSDKIEVGDSVIAIGSPLGLSGTVTLGIISAKNRPVTAGGSASENSFINALQTDAAINPGNSGGPLVDATGSVIGVNSAIASLGSSSQAGSIGLGFAIPINQARKTAEQLIKNGKATYPILGVSLDMSYTGLGALVSKSASGVMAGGPAQKAGLKPGDIIFEFERREINAAEDLIVAVRAKNVGDSVTIRYQRDGKEFSTTIILVAAKD